MFLLTLCLVFCAGAHGARILGIVHMPAYSHYALGNRIFEELAAKGHDVTFVSAYQRKNPVKNLKDVHLSGIAELMHESKQNFFEMAQINRFLMLAFLDSIGGKLTDAVFSHPNVQKLMKSNEKFDLVITEHFANEGMYGFANYYKCPHVLLSTIGSSRWINSQVGNPTNPAFIPELLLHYGIPMTFFQRVYNTVFYMISQILKHIRTLPMQNEILHKYIPDAPDIYDIYHNVSLVLLNSDVSTNQPVPRVPNMIDIGGFHVYPPKELPKDLKSYLDEAKQGAIFFSLGSNLKSKEMDPAKLKSLLNIFSKLKQKVLWKWEDETLPGKPANVKIGKWLPQQDILAHPNIVLFITHGGLLSTIEAIYHGVPLVAIPVFGDQEINAAAAENAGYAKSMKYHEFDEEKLENAIHEVLNNPTYKSNVKLRSRIMHDQETKPLDRAVFWIEYVIKYGGAHHLKNAGILLPWYQYFLLDVIAFLTAIIGIMFTMIYLLFVKCCCRKKVAKVSTSKKTK